MGLLKFLFGGKKLSIVKRAKSKYKGFDIQHLPHVDKYFPRYKGKYLFWWEATQNYTLKYNIGGCRYSHTVQGAKAIIDRYLELRGVKANIIKLD